MRFTSRIYIDSSCSSDASSRGTRMGRAANTSPSLHSAERRVEREV